MTIDPLLLNRTIAGFTAAHGRAPTIVAFAPGRVNLIGEHTDYNDGFALPCALSVGTVVALAPRADAVIAARAIDLGDADARFAVSTIPDRLAEGHWENHLRGIVAGLPRFGLSVAGADIAVAGNIPQGAGLSSSASLGVALGLGLAALAGEGAPDRVALARVAQWSEHHYVGCACGLMDQLASVLGDGGKALLVDCRSLTGRAVPFPAGAAILIVHSGVTRGLVDSAYNERRAQCARVAARLGVTALRDVDLAMLNGAKARIEPVDYARALHVVTENDRTLAAVEAMAAGDLAQLGALMRQSHASLRDDFAVSVPAMDSLVDCLNAAIGDAGGARMTGGGFGGCAVAVMQAERVQIVEAALAAHWLAKGIAPQMTLRAVPSPGAHLVPQ